MVTKNEISLKFPSSLQHPNVVRMLGLYSNESDHYMVMELVSSGSLKDLLKRLGTQVTWNSQLEM
jgi:serine/threonine protein kinase